MGYVTENVLVTFYATEIRDFNKLTSKIAHVNVRVVSDDMLYFITKINNFTCSLH